MQAEESISPAVAEILRVYDAAPEFGRLRTEVLMGDVWEQKELSQRDRSMITCALLAAQGRKDELASHVQKAIANGITPDEFRGMAVHLAFYAGWPSGLALGRAALDYLEADLKSQS